MSLRNTEVGNNAHAAGGAQSLPVFRRIMALQLEVSAPAWEVDMEGVEPDRELHAQLVRVTSKASPIPSSLFPLLRSCPRLEDLQLVTDTENMAARATRRGVGPVWGLIEREERREGGGCGAAGEVAGALARMTF
jgi:hypothetical protein